MKDVGHILPVLFSFIKPTNYKAEAGKCQQLPAASTGTINCKCQDAVR